ncbi:MAG: hypothetical protein SFW09_03970 [Hyphomicrobiaceae bacterium]|nr:hypothetical protein [Hyphomicrobiaceae bacterium]
MPMLAIALLALVGLVAPDPAASAPPPRRGPQSHQKQPAPALGSPPAILQWINAYRSRPDPKVLPEAVKAMSRLALFRDLDAGGVYVGFMAGVLGDNPVEADRLVAAMFPMPPEDQVAIVRAIAYSGLDDWKGLLQRFAERMPARRVLIQRHLESKLPTRDKLKLEGAPVNLDTLWGYYFATGRPAEVNRIVDALAWVKDGNDADRLTAGNMAKWTLANNAQLDKELLDHLRNEASRRPKEVAKELNEVVEAAETFETARIRKEAQAALEELKRKGPENVRKLTFWGMAGQTALALGCVVAGTLGHPEIAVPCVIGGAASSAALRILTPQ